MAVFTPVSPEQAAALLAALDAGALADLQGIGGGIENTNYFVTSRRDGQTLHWVLTLFERLPEADLPFYLGLMQHLAARGLPVPAPQADGQGRLWQRVAGKPAALVQRLPGEHLDAPDLAHCAQLGTVLARMHLAAADFAPQQPNPRGLAWWLATAPQVAPHLDAGQQRLLADELAFQQALHASAEHAQLPRAAVHADLFRDNVLFDGPADRPDQWRLSGCLDFYFAANDTLAYDLAVCLNDWCLGADGVRLDEARAQALVDAYQAQRPLTGAEQRLLPALLRAAALRFWLSRAADWHLPRQAALLAPKDPAHFERLLRARIAEPWHPGPAAAA